MTDICPNCDEVGCEETYFSYKYLCPNDECWVHTFDGRIAENPAGLERCDGGFLVALYNYYRETKTSDPTEALEWLERVLSDEQIRTVVKCYLMCKSVDDTADELMVTGDA